MPDDQNPKPEITKVKRGNPTHFVFRGTDGSVNFTPVASSLVLFDVDGTAMLMLLGAGQEGAIATPIQPGTAIRTLTAKEVAKEVMVLNGKPLQ